ncbi:uncharacterized protein LOC141855127 [Brevipalpus obovatus]|uniref:uncharacterized protein LOC141855127 n=1 Tax=Brevipalpus obovatus TaxID=246614 RepID=UPI003D9E4B18
MRSESIKLGLLNTFNRSQACIKAIEVIDKQQGDWILGLNEHNLKDTSRFLNSKNLRIFGGLEGNRAIIITTCQDATMVENGIEGETISITIKRASHNIIVTCLYLCPTRCAKKTIDDYHEFVRTHRQAQHVLMGDVNAKHPKWGGEITCTRGKYLSRSLRHNKFDSIINHNDTSWTRDTGSSERGNWIDLIMANNKLKKFCCNSRVIRIEESDHKMLLVSVTTPVDRVKKFDENRFIGAVKNSNWEFVKRAITNREEAEDIAESIMKAMRDLNEKGKTMVSFKRGTHHNIDIVRERRTIKRRLKKIIKARNSNPDTVPEALTENKIIELKSREKFLTHQINKEGKENVQKRVKELRKKKGDWWFARQILGKNFRANPEVNETTHKMLDLEKTEKELTNDFTSTRVSSRTDCSTKNLEVRDLQEKEIRRIMKKIKAKPCVFDEGLSCKNLSLILKYSDGEIIHFAMNCLRKGIIPDNIKVARIKLIPKAAHGKFRPLSIMNPLYRLFDAIMYELIEREIDFRKILHQYGFKPNCGAIDLHLSLKHKLAKIMREDPDGHYILVSIDMTNAFESISYMAILGGLSSLNCSNAVKTLVMEFLSNRSSFIVRNGEKRWNTHRQGTPQGGFSSPVLFIIGLNLISFLHDDKEFGMYSYADDLNVVIRANDNGSRWSNGNDKLRRLKASLKLMKLEINASKTQSMIFYSKKNGNNWPPSMKFFEIDGDHIEVGRGTTILGLPLRTAITRADRKFLFQPMAINVMVEKIRKLQADLSKHSARLQVLTLSDYQLVIRAITMGTCQYYGLSLRIWNDWKSFVKDCELSMKVIGEIMIESLDLRKSMSRELLYRMLAEEDLALMINKNIEHHQAKIDNDSTESSTVRLSYPEFDPYGMKIIENDITPGRDEKTTTFLGIREIKNKCCVAYFERRFEWDLWIEIILYLNNKPSRKKLYNFWSPNGYHLEAISHSISDFLKDEEKLLESGELILCANLDVQNRLMNPKTRDNLTKLMREKIRKCWFHKGIGGKAKVTDEDRKLIPRNVPRFTNIYWKLLSTLNDEAKAEEAENICSENLFRSSFRAIIWKKMRRTQLFGITLLAGSWRDKDHEDVRCCACDTQLTTENILLGACEHVQPVTSKAIKVATKENVIWYFQSLNRMSCLSIHLRDTLKKHCSSDSTYVSTTNRSD